GTRAMTASCIACLLESTQSVAPALAAISSLVEFLSTAMMRAAPASFDAITTLRPTPPQPTTATVEPGVTLAVLSAAPTPVVTPQPARQMTSSGTSLG